MKVADLRAMGFLLFFSVLDGLYFPVPKVSDVFLPADFHLPDPLYFFLLECDLILGVLADPSLILIFCNFGEVKPFVFGFLPVELLWMYLINNFLPVGLHLWVLIMLWFPAQLIQRLHLCNLCRLLHPSIAKSTTGYITTSFGSVVSWI